MTSHAAASPPSTLRPDVQPLRALAILLVVVDRARLIFLPGGFLGVGVAGRRAAHGPDPEAGPMTSTARRDRPIRSPTSLSRGRAQPELAFDVH